MLSPVPSQTGRCGSPKLPSLSQFARREGYFLELSKQAERACGSFGAHSKLDSWLAFHGLRQNHTREVSTTIQDAKPCKIAFCHDVPVQG